MARKRVHVKTGTTDRTGAAHPYLRAPGEAPRAERGQKRGGSQGPRREDGRGRERRPETALARARREEREARQAQQRALLRRRAAAVVAAVVVVGGLVIGAYASPLFTIDSVEVRGTSALDPTEVAGRIQLPEGATLLRFPRSRISSELAGDPWIAEVGLGAHLPSTLVIDIEERIPVALVDTGAAFWYIDGQGRTLGTSSLDTTDSPLPVIRDVPGLAPVAGEITDDAALANALKVLQGVTDELRSIVRAVSAASPHETTLVTESGVEVMVGEAVQLSEKSGLALDIMAEQGAGIVFIDVRSVDRPISRGL